MIKINFVEPVTQDWDDWKKKCEEACAKAIEDVKTGVRPGISELYKEKKSILFSGDCNFHGKCAYCETNIISNQPGDVEHFRPKGRVTDINNKKVIITDSTGTSKDHPGYYWLAYKLSNLLPSCADCNRPSSGNSGGISIGKWDRFPVNGIYATGPGEELHEDPLLINPVLEDPDLHLEVNDLGILFQKSEKGRISIEVFGLNHRQGLIDERKTTYSTVTNLLNLLLIYRADKVLFDRHFAEVNKHKSGKLPYSIAARKAILDFTKDIDKFRTIMP